MLYRYLTEAPPEPYVLSNTVSLNAVATNKCTISGSLYDEPLNRQFPINIRPDGFEYLNLYSTSSIIAYKLVFSIDINGDIRSNTTTYGGTLYSSSNVYSGYYPSTVLPTSTPPAGSEFNIVYQWAAIPSKKLINALYQDNAYFYVISTNEKSRWDVCDYSINAANTSDAVLAEIRADTTPRLSPNKQYYVSKAITSLANQIAIVKRSDGSILKFNTSFTPASVTWIDDTYIFVLSKTTYTGSGVNAFEQYYGHVYSWNTSGTLTAVVSNYDLGFIAGGYVPKVHILPNGNIFLNIDLLMNNGEALQRCYSFNGSSLNTVTINNPILQTSSATIPAQGYRYSHIQYISSQNKLLCFSKNANNRICELDISTMSMSAGPPNANIISGHRDLMFYIESINAIICIWTSMTTINPSVPFTSNLSFLKNIY